MNIKLVIGCGLLFLGIILWSYGLPAMATPWVYNTVTIHADEFLEHDGDIIVNNTVYDDACVIRSLNGNLTMEVKDHSMDDIRNNGIGFFIIGLPVIIVGVTCGGIGTADIINERRKK